MPLMNEIYQTRPFFRFLIDYDSKTTPARGKLLPQIDFLDSNYPNMKFSSQT